MEMEVPLKRRIGWLGAASLLLLATSAAGQGFWDKKEWKKWSAEDCKKMLQDSPWARRWSQTESKMAEFASKNPTAGGTQGVGDESKLEVWYVIQLRSSLPIRAAIVRQQAIQLKYDSDEKIRAAVDKQAEGILGAKFDDVIIVHVYYGSNIPQYERELATVWQSVPPGTVPQAAFLNLESGKKVTPLRFVSPKSGSDEFELIFPRVVDGEPAITANSKVVGVEFHSPAVQRVPEGRVYVEFKPDKMKYNGALSY
jgi:hypothetical protein